MRSGPMWVPGLAPGSSHGPGGLGVQGAEQCGEWVGDLDRVVAEPEADLRSVEVEVVGAERDDPGDALAVEQDQAARDAGREFERVVVE